MDNKAKYPSTNADIRRAIATLAQMLGTRAGEFSGVDASMVLAMLSGLTMLLELEIFGGKTTAQ